jgi:hypothetical protein
MFIDFYKFADEKKRLTNLALLFDFQKIMYVGTFNLSPNADAIGSILRISMVSSLTSDSAFEFGSESDWFEAASSVIFSATILGSIETLWASEGVTSRESMGVT